jgi:hypothetical protein
LRSTARRRARLRATTTGERRHCLADAFADLGRMTAALHPPAHRAGNL